MLHGEVFVVGVTVSLADAGGLEGIAELISRQLPARRGTDALIVLPEYLAFAQLNLHETREKGWDALKGWMAELARTHKAFVVGSSISDSLENLSVLFNPYGEEVAVVHKAKATAEEIQAGIQCRGTRADSRMITLPFGTLGILNCFDMFHPDIVDTVVGADIIAIPSANPRTWLGTTADGKTWQPEEWFACLESVALRTGAVLVNPMLQGLVRHLQHNEDLLFEGQGSISRSASKPTYMNVEGVSPKHLNLLCLEPSPYRHNHALMITLLSPGQ